MSQQKTHKLSEIVQKYKRTTEITGMMYLAIDYLGKCLNNAKNNTKCTKTIPSMATNLSTQQDNILHPEDLSYASYFLGKPIQYGLVKVIEILSARRSVYKYYKDYLKIRSEEKTFWDQMIELTGFSINYDRDKLNEIPKEGPLVVVANHPFGVIDGFAVNYLVSRVRRDYKVLTASVLTHAPEARPWLIPIRFDQSREALEENLKARREAMDILKNGGCIVVFPAGSVMSTESIFSKQAYDAEWQPFIGKLIQSSGATVAPMFFEGQNSRMFQIASHVSVTLRSSLFLNELKKHIKKGEMNVEIGEVLDYKTELSHFSDRKELMRHLQIVTFALGGIDYSEVEFSSLNFDKDFNMNPYRRKS